MFDSDTDSERWQFALWSSELVQLEAKRLIARSVEIQRRNAEVRGEAAAFRDAAHALTAQSSSLRAHLPRR